MRRREVLTGPPALAATLAPARPPMPLHDAPRPAEWQSPEAIAEFQSVIENGRN